MAAFATLAEAFAFAAGAFAFPGVWGFSPSTSAVDWERDLGRSAAMAAIAATAAENQIPNAPTPPAQDPFSLSRLVAPGESIDFFISHSWHDDAQLKHRQLRLLVEAFKRRHGREPTFWFDKTCIDQANIGDGLRMLPVNVMACERILVLWGPTYHERLWCVRSLAG